MYYKIFLFFFTKKKKKSGRAGKRWGDTRGIQNNRPMKKDKSHIDNKLTLCVSSLPFFRPLLLLLLLRGINNLRPFIYCYFFFFRKENDGPRKRVSSSKSLYEIVCRKLCVRDLHYHFFFLSPPPFFF